MNKHTPGPWSFKAYPEDHDCLVPSLSVWVSADGWEQFAHVATGNNIDGNDPEGIANARLISAAPDLLAALQTLCSMRDMSSDQLTAAWDAARAAIAKATGA